MKLGEVEWKQACKGGCHFLEGILERLSERAACGKETEGGQGVSSGCLGKNNTDSKRSRQGCARHV